MCNVLVAAPAQARGVSFITRQEFGVGVNPASVAIGDFNGDALLDLAVANECKRAERSREPVRGAVRLDSP